MFKTVSDSDNESGQSDEVSSSDEDSGKDD